MEEADFAENGAARRRELLRAFCDDLVGTLRKNLGGTTLAELSDDFEHMVR